MGWFSRTSSRPDPALLDAVEDLKRRLRTAEHEIAELGDRFRRYQSRTARRAALDADDQEAPPAAAPPRNGLPSVHQLRAAGKLRW